MTGEVANYDRVGHGSQELEASADKELAKKVFQAGIEVSSEAIGRAQKIHEGKWSHFDDRGPELKDYIGATDPLIVYRESMYGGRDLEITFVDPVQAGELSVLLGEDSKPFRKTQTVLHLAANSPSLDDLKQGEDPNPYVTFISFEEGIEAKVGTTEIERTESVNAYRVDASGEALSGVALRHRGLVEVDVDAEVKLRGSLSLDDGQRYGVVKGGSSPLPAGVAPEDVVERVLRRFDAYTSGQDATNLE